MSCDLSALTILLVEDEDLLRWTIRKKLEEAGCRVLDAPSCREAMDIASRTGVDLLLSDFRLDDGFGDDLARKVVNPGGRTALILMSGEAENIPQDGFEDIDLLKIMKKPLDFEELYKIIKDWAPVRSKVDKVVKSAGIFRVVRVDSVQDAVSGIECGFDNTALEVSAGFSGDGDELVRFLVDRAEPGRRVCVVGGGNDELIDSCRRAGIETAVTVSDLDVLSRRMVSGAERAAVLALTQQEEP